ncbi:hypothetical protein FHX42_003527 [Saccharopolyspora lacisalsi]|uniref:Uncharacterized protein n=1 Tax=Halosaccharopolyspora lacisalsi TaxID=1000566 RepID=A0A839E467_9PSEU|nr:hypothetical protein [Halosaccharopolyspora lacisalsi]MBA8826151.1 hypothetical protein [Halosaccharopolyspora lacisalsi]
MGCDVDVRSRESLVRAEGETAPRRGKAPRRSCDTGARTAERAGGGTRRRAEAPGSWLEDRIGPITDVRDLLGLGLLAVGGVGMVVLELAVAVGGGSRHPLAIVLIGGSALCLLGGGLRRAGETKWFVGLLCFAVNAVGVYAFDSALYAGDVAKALLLVPMLLLFSAGAVLVLALNEPDQHGDGGR